MPIGEYRWRVTVLARSLAAPTSATHGEPVPSWPDPPEGTGGWWAKVEAAGGGETLQQGLRQTADAVRVTIPWRAVPVATVDRLRVELWGVVYAISRIGLDGETTVCDCVRVR